MGGMGSKISEGGEIECLIELFFPYPLIFLHRSQKVDWYWVRGFANLFHHMYLNTA